MRNIIIIIALTAAATWLNWEHLKPFLSNHLAFNTQESEYEEPIPDPATYKVLIDEVNFHKSKLSEQYLYATSAAEKAEIIESARNLLELTMPALMRCWLGTKWDFNGTETVPGEGKIACGYYVSTVLRDSGFNIERIKLAQQASQNILLTFLSKDELSIKSGQNYERYMTSLRALDHGIYIIGLDKHVGFIINDKEGLHFLHSGGEKRQVVDEKKHSASSIKKSRYRVIGNLTKSDTLIEKWLTDQPFITQT